MINKLLMRLPILVRPALIMSLAMMSCGVSARAQKLKEAPQQESYLVDNETYIRVLDMLFPSDALAGVFGYSLIIRHWSSSGIESQITVTNEAGKIEVVEYTPRAGNIYEQLNKIFQRTKQQNAAYMAKRIRINKRVVVVPAPEVKRIRESLYDHIRMSAEYEEKIVSENMETAPLLIDDGTRYAIWYRGASRFHFDLIGSNINQPVRPDEHPLIRWTKDVWRSVVKLPTANRSRLSHDKFNNLNNPAAP